MKKIHYLHLSQGVPKKKDWKKEAIEQLEINKSLLYDAMNRKIPIFAYYYGVWIDECKELLEYPYYSPCINHYNPAIKRNYLKNVIIPDWEKRKVIQKNQILKFYQVSVFFID